MLYNSMILHIHYIQDKLVDVPTLPNDIGIYIGRYIVTSGTSNVVLHISKSLASSKMSLSSRIPYLSIIIIIIIVYPLLSYYATTLY